MIENNDNKIVGISLETVDAIWEIAHGADGWERDFPPNETIRILQAYEKKAHQLDEFVRSLGYEVEEDF
tara:strand:- start:306 stop:512 length:207 start_codon:yes stop_codon:yes gene_type:complete